MAHGLRAGWSTGGDDEYPGNAVVVQIKDIKTAGGKTYKASDTQINSTEEKCLVADDFRQEEFVSPYTGQVLPYNIYLPEDYDPAKKLSSCLVHSRCRSGKLSGKAASISRQRRHVMG